MGRHSRNKKIVNECVEENTDDEESEEDIPEKKRNDNEGELMGPSKPHDKDVNVVDVINEMLEQKTYEMQQICQLKKKLFSCPQPGTCVCCDYWNLEARHPNPNRARGYNRGRSYGGRRYTYRGYRGRGWDGYNGSIFYGQGRGRGYGPGYGPGYDNGCSIDQYYRPWY